MLPHSFTGSNAKHTFSFGRYVDRAHMGFRDLRVINEDIVAPGAGFPTHPHENMEILTYVLSGELAHKDSLGHTEVVRPGQIQRMSAGTGIEHSEFNPSPTNPVHLLQIWLLPAEDDTAPSYEQIDIPTPQNNLSLLASPSGERGSTTIGQDARVYAANLAPGQAATLDLKPGRHAWVQVARGTADLNGHQLSAGDGASISEETTLALTAREPFEALVFDLN